jgi:hypothetical protein
MPITQSHIDYLLTTIDNDMDKEISMCGPIFRQSREQFALGILTENEVREGLGYLVKLVLPRTTAKFHAEKLFNAAIDYIIDPTKVLNAEVGSVQ